jgi:predicted nucleic acid-binding protein
MVLIDSDVFILDLFYPADPRAGANRRFIDRDIPERATTIFNVLEVCGIASFNKSSEDLKRLFYEFHQTYNLNILYPDVLFPSAEDFLKHLVARAFARILLRMNFNDALILATAESFNAAALVTWNVKHFENRTSIQIVTPEDFLKG